MARTMNDIAAHAEELSARFENDDFGFTGTVEITDGLAGLTHAVIDAANAQNRVALWVGIARQQGRSWSAIGRILGTSGQAARQKYGNRRATA